MCGGGSSARPFWFALFEERFDPLAEICAFSDARSLTNSRAKSSIELRACVIGQQPLGIGKRKRTVLSQLSGEFPGTTEQLFRRNDFIDQAHLQGFRRVEDAAREQEVASDFFADLAQQKSRDNSGNESDANLGVTKLGIWHGEREVAKQRQSGPAGDGRAIYRGNRWFGKFIERTE